MQTLRLLRELSPEATEGACETNNYIKYSK